jgi:hypothetical protein
MKTLLLLSLTLILCTSYAQTPLPKEFTDLLSRAKMEFTAPKGYKQVAPVKNRQMNWELAYRHPNT